LSSFAKKVYDSLVVSERLPETEAAALSEIALLWIVEHAVRTGGRSNATRCHINATLYYAPRSRNEKEKLRDVCQDSPIGLSRRPLPILTYQVE